MNTHPRIEISADIMFGKPVIKGTRITVQQILYKLGAGIPVEEILKEHPNLKVEDIHAAQNFAADHLSGEEVIFM